MKKSFISLIAAIYVFIFPMNAVAQAMDNDEKALMKFDDIEFTDQEIESAKFEFDRGPCLPTPCSFYTVTISGDGSVAFSPIKGSFITNDFFMYDNIKYNIDKEIAKKFIKKLPNIGFLKSTDYICYECNDGFNRYMKLEIGKTFKSIELYFGNEVGMPQSIDNIEYDIRDITGIDRFMEGNERAVDFLKSRRFDFSSQKSIDMMSRLIYNDYYTTDRVKEIISIIEKFIDSGMNLNVKANKMRFFLKIK